MSEKQKVPENQEKKNQENTAHNESKGQEGDNGKDKGGFFSLCPSVLENNEEYKSYYEALDYAFQNKDIKNIAITGIYGAGKSTVWKSYAKERDLKNIVTITLGQYESSVDRGIGSKIERETEEGNGRTNYNQEIEQENRIERKLINQIISQISIKDTPLSKYKIKINKSKNEIYRETIFIVCFLLSILLWLAKEWIFGGLREPLKQMLLIIFSILELESKAELILQCLKHSSPLLHFIFCLLFFVIPLYYFLLRFVRENRFFIHKIQLKGIETIINDGNIDEESVLDKDIKEIIYLLTSAEVKTLVIEDLDRFNTITIFTKLRELNYMLNKHLEVSHCDRNVRFVYMLRDGIMESKDRVKFFDFVLPVLPYICSKNSESILSRGLGRFGFDSNDRLIIATSLYIDEMRILKNIINEYQIYEKILNINKLNSSKNKLFALLVIKNLFPCEFDLLQMNQGYLYNLFHKKEDYVSNRNICDTLKSRINGKDGKIDEINRHILELLHRSNSLGLSEFLACISSVEEEDDYFRYVADNAEVQCNQYFSLIKFLVKAKYFAEDYFLYMSPFHKGDLTENDMIFMKKFYGGDNNAFTKIDNPEDIYSRLSEDDYMKPNILNSFLLKDSLIELNEEDDYLVSKVKDYIQKRFLSIMDSVHHNNNYIDLVAILSDFDYEDIKRYVSIMIQTNPQYLEIVLNIVSKKKEVNEDEKLTEFRYSFYHVDKDQAYHKIKNQILRALMLSPKEQGDTIFSDIKDIIENSSSVLLTLERNELNSFFNTMVSEGMYFKDPDFWKNINSIVKKELPPNTSYSDYFNDTHKSSEFSSIWEYIETNYSECIKSYVDNVQENGAVDNNTCTELFVVVAQKVQGILDELPKEISEEACFALIEYGHIKINKANVHTLVDMSCGKAIYNWLRKVEEQDQNELIECLCNEDIDRMQEYLDFSLKLIKCEKSACRLIKAMKGKTKIFRLIKENLILFVITEFPIIPENIKFICTYFSDFKYKKEFVDSLISHNQFQDLKDEDLNKDVMKYLLACTSVGIENKVMLLKIKIQNKVEENELKEYIGSVNEIKDLNEVWNKKQPILDSTYKQDIGNALADNGYAKIINASPTPYIVL